jgi:hypothetical protein
VVQTESRIITQDLSVLEHQNRVIACVRDQVKNLRNKIKVDYLIIGNNAFRNYSQIDKLFEFDVLIMDGSNSWWNCNRILAGAEERGRKIHSVLHQGAYFENL